MRFRLTLLLSCSCIGFVPALGQEAPAARPVLNSLALEACHFTVEADDSFATVVVEERFFNQGKGLREADFYFPLPAHAAPSGLQLQMGGRYYGGNLLTRGRARRIYNEITRRSRDPALLDCVGKDLWRCRVFPVPANGHAGVKFSYRQPLQPQGAMRRLVIPLDAARFNRSPAGEFALSIRVKTKAGLQAVICPTHEVKIQRKGAHEARVTLAARNAYLARDLVLLYAVDDAPLGTVVSSFRRPGKPGYFVLSIDAAFAREQQRNAPRDVVLAVDTSNSAGREGVSTAAAAVAQAIDALGARDRYALVSFGTEPRVLREFAHPVPGTADEVRGLFAHQPVAGRTRLAAAIRGAAALADRGRPGTGIILLTDGRESEARADASRAAHEVAETGHRIGLCGVGRELDPVRLDVIGDKGRGDSAYPTRRTGLTESMRHLLDSTRQVPLTDVEVRIKGVSDTYPQRIRMVKPGDSITVAGRYHRAGPVEVTIRGKVSGELVTRKLTVDLVGSGGDPAVARLWAARRIGVLLDEARLAGEPDLHKREIVKLGRRFGIVTPHTSLLVLESDDQQRFLGGMRRRPLLVADGGEVTEVRTVTREYASEAELARRIRSLKRCNSGAANPFADLLGANRLKQRRVGDRTFYRDERHIWVEADLVGREPAHPRIVRFLSDDWQALADQGGEVAKVLALGSKVLLTLPDGTAVRVVD